MKRFSLVLLPLALMIFIFVGCGGGSKKVDTTKLEQIFQSAPADLKSEISKATAAVKTGDYATAATAFKAAAKKGGLSQEQKDAVVAVVTEIQMIASQDPNRYPVEVYRSIGEIMPMLDGQSPTARQPNLRP